MTSVDVLQKALDEWWNDYNHLLGDASGDSECRRKLQRIVRRFSVFQKGYDKQIARLRSAEEKNVEYAKLVASQAQEYAEKIEKLQKELNEANLLCELQASRISGLETFKKQCNGKVLVDKKQVADIIVGHCSGYYHCNRSSYSELKELFLVEGSKETIE